MRDNIVTDNLRDGILVRSMAPESASNLFLDNELSGNGSSNPAMFNNITDQTLGAGTAGTQNTYIDNGCDTSSPAGLCE